MAKAQANLLFQKLNMTREQILHKFPEVQITEEIEEENRRAEKQRDKEAKQRKQEEQNKDTLKKKYNSYLNERASNANMETPDENLRHLNEGDLNMQAAQSTVNVPPTADICGPNDNSAVEMAAKSMPNINTMKMLQRADTTPKENQDFCD